MNRWLLNGKLNNKDLLDKEVAKWRPADKGHSHLSELRHGHGTEPQEGQKGRVTLGSTEVLKRPWDVYRRTCQYNLDSKETIRSSQLRRWSSEVCDFKGSNAGRTVSRCQGMGMETRSQGLRDKTSSKWERGEKGTMRMKPSAVKKLKDEDAIGMKWTRSRTRNNTWTSFCNKKATWVCSLKDFKN